MTLYVEVTHTEHSDMTTGITRVVRNVLKNLIELGSGRGIAVVPVVLRKDSLVVVSAERVLRDRALGHSRGRVEIGRSGGITRAIVKWWRRAGNFAESRWKSSLANAIRAAPDQRHVLLLLDASWAYDIWNVIERLELGQLRVVSVIYDLIPVTHSETVVEALVQAFERWLQGQMRFADGIVCISRSAADVVRRYLEEHMAPRGPARNVRVTSFYLGADRKLAQRTRPVQERFLELKMVASPMFLMVGTIEPRKNHRQVLDAFTALWADGVDARLAIVGAEEWKSEKLLAEIAQHAELGRRLLLIRDASDSDLQWFYENATALIMASRVEGFGLPIAEARQMGLPMICSDIPVFRELAPQGTEFFRLGDVGDLVRIVGAHAASREASHRAQGGWITWRESADQLLNAVLDITEAKA